ncbi:hypothetical protein OSTOST_15758 [Ostertagia ostertagi]
MVAGKRNQIGHVPMKGNLWRAKQRSEISPNVSVEFARFAKHCKTTTSEDTGITYHYSPNGTVYPLAENFTLYFACDDTCCAMECCQRDIEMTIIRDLLPFVKYCLLWINRIG